MTGKVASDPPNLGLAKKIFSRLSTPATRKMKVSLLIIKKAVCWQYNLMPKSVHNPKTPLAVGLSKLTIFANRGLWLQCIHY